MKTNNYTSSRCPRLLCFTKHLSRLVTTILPVLLGWFSLSAAHAASPPGTWYKIRTNGVPQSPINLTRGASGDLWMASSSNNELGAWRWPDGGQLLHITGDLRENDLGRSANMTEKAQLAGKDVNFAADDAAGNTWYATENGGVLVQKADNSWVVFNTTQPTERQLASNQMRRIRFGPGGIAMLMGPTGGYVVNSTFQITQQRTGIVYNNDFVNDMMVDSSGRYWVATNRGVYRGTDIGYSAAHVSTIYTTDANEPPFETPIARMEQDAGGHIWFLANSYGDSGIYCLTASDVWERYTSASAPALGTSTAYDLVAMPNGDVWFGLNYTNGVGLFRRGSGWSRITLTTLGIDGYGAESITAIGGNLWFSSGYNPAITGNGTGVHKLTLNASGDYVSHQSYTYRNTTTTVPSNRCRAVAGDKSGNVWFGDYDDSVISRRKPNGTWETFTSATVPFTMNFGIVAIAVDSANIVYFYTHNAPPFAYNATTDTWVTLPTASTGSFGYPYGIHIDGNDGKWFHNSDGVMHLDATNTTWTYYSTSGPGTGLPSQYVDYGVRVDRYGNTWFGTRGGLAMYSPSGTWTNFTPGTAGYGYASDGTPYKAILDDNGEIWSQAGLKYNYATVFWSSPTDNSAWANRNVPFTNGKVFLGTDTSKAKGVIVNMTGSSVTAMDEDLMTLGTNGTVYQGRWAFTSDWGVLAYDQPADALTIAPLTRNHAAAASQNHTIDVTASRAWTAVASAPWIGISSGTSGGGDGVIKYALGANANATAASRSGTITVTSLGGLVQTFTINQAGVLLAPTGELLANPDFNVAAGDQWQIAAAANRATMFAINGEANMHLTSFTGKLLWQNLNLSNVAGMAFRVGATLHSGAFPAGKSVAVYLDYLDATGTPKRLLVLEPENRDIHFAGSYFENQVTLPLDAQTLTGFSVDRLGAGEFTAESFTLTSLGYAIPIVSLAQLQGIGVSPELPLTGNYLLMNDIDASPTQFENGGQGFAPIGGLTNTAMPFTGSFDGQDHLITGLHINRATLDAIGLFRVIAGRAVIQRLGLKGGSISGQSSVGAIVGMSDNSTVLRCSSSAYVSGLGNVGGVVGDNHSGTVQECLGAGQVMGLLPTSPGTGSCGGVVGLNMGMVRDCYGTGAVHAISHYSAGGLAGTNLGQGQILRTHASGAVTGNATANLGGLVGDATDVDFVQASFWDTETSGQAASDGGTGRTTVLMKQQSTFTPTAGWDFANVWAINEGVSYPYLRALVNQITPPLSITQEPVDHSAPLTGSVQFTVQIAGGLAPITYRWQRNQTDLTEGGKYTGTNTATLTVGSLALTDNGSHYRVIITDAASNVVTSEEATLTVIPAPTATTSAPTANFATRATLAGSVNGFGLSTVVDFLWGTSSTALNQTAAAFPSPITAAGVTGITAEITGLTGATTYYYRVRAVSDAGTTLGSILNFKTPTPVPPIVTTSAATNVTHDGAFLRGTVNARNAETMVSFEYGLTMAYGNTSPGEPHFVFGSTVQNVFTVVTGLLPHTKYNYRVKGESDRGAANGLNMTFTTLDRAPVAVADSFVALPLSPVVLDVLGNDTDPDGDALTIASFTQPVVTAGTVSKLGSTLLFSPKSTFSGGSFTYTISDGFGKTHTATVTLTLGTAAPLNPESYNIASNGGTYPVGITTTATWGVSESLTWASGSPSSGTGNGTVTIVVQPNTSKTPRSGTVFIGGRSHLINQAGVQSPQISVPATIPTGIVSGTYTLPIPTVNGPVTYVVTGLPRGLAISQATGIIGGKPQVYGDFTITVKATNAAGSTPVISFPMHVLATPASARGTFTGLIQRDATFNEGFGGLLTFKSSSLGSLTGTVKLGGTSLNIPITGQLEVPVNGGSPTAHVVIPRTGKPALVLDLTLNSGSTGHFLASLTVDQPGGASINFDGYRHSWTSDATAGKYAGRYTAAYDQPDNAALLPQGSGFSSLTCDVNGVVNWAGKLADGTPFTGSSTLWSTAQMPVFQMLYLGKGSIIGAPQITLPVAANGLRTLSGVLSWSKKPQTTRAYALGFDPTNLTVAGGDYFAPEDGEIIVGLPDVPLGQNNAAITFDEGGINSVAQFVDLDQPVRFTSAGLATLSTSTTTNPGKVKITTLSKTTGVFTGSMTLLDPGPVSRTVPIEGVMLFGTQSGKGFLLLPQMPVPPSLNSTTTPQQSGRVIITPVGG